MSELPLLAPTESDQGVHNANNQILRGALADVDETLTAVSDTLDGGLNSANFTQSAWTAFTPTLTASGSNPTLGTGGVITGSYTRQADRLIAARYVIRFGTAGISVGSGYYHITLPTQSNGALTGSGRLFDISSGTPNHVVIAVQAVNSTGFELYSPLTPTAPVTAISPIAWAINDYVFIGAVLYESVS